MNKRKKNLKLNKLFYKYLLYKKLKIFKNNFYNDLFIKKIFFILISEGKKIKAINIFLNWVSILKFLFVKKYKNINLKHNKKKLHFSLYKFIFVSRLSKIISPKIGAEGFFKKGVLSKLPILSNNNYKDKTKIFTTVSLWIKRSIISRKEKTFILKFYSELFDINLKKGNSYKQKIEYYKVLYQNKKLYKFKRWI